MTTVTDLPLVPAEEQWHDVLSEINDRLAAMAEAACSRGEALAPPFLMLGTSERVGSNWMSDSLRPAIGQHNEPFRQQLGADHPLSPLNARSAAGKGGIQPTVGRLGLHWLVTFSVSKYGTARQMVKETNLFFALPVFLALFPGAPVVVLSRSPLGVASSFIRSGLFDRWGYRARYQDLVTATQAGSSYARQFRALLPDDQPTDLVMLTRLQVLNTVLLAEALGGRHITHIAYETTVISPEQAQAAFIAGLGLGQTDLGLKGPQDRSRPNQADDDTFTTTNARTNLVACLEHADAEAVRTVIAESLATAQDLVPGPAVARAAAWLAGDHLYRLAPLRARPPAARSRPCETSCVAAARYIPRGGLDVRNLLVSNAEYADFLNEICAAGMPNSHAGNFLLACVVSHERGGRLHENAATRRWEASAGYEDRPVYWVTWIGAAAFAAWHGSRLPDRAEMMDLTLGAVAANAAYRYGDVAPVIEPELPDSAIHHLLGNLQVWCGDGPVQSLTSPLARWLFGVAWNTPADPEEARRPRHRHILGCSRGVGIRLVRDGRQRAASSGELAARIAGWISSLTARSRPLAEIDAWLVQALDASQADVVLGAHVTSGPRETGHG